MFMTIYGAIFQDIYFFGQLEALAAVQESRKDINLARRPGTMIRSGVSVPAFMAEEDAGDSELDVVSDEDEMVDLDDSSDV